jgi:heat shock protein HslJ
MICLKKGLSVLPLAAALVLAACAGGPSSQDNTVVFDDLLGQTWKLVEVRIGQKSIGYDRQQLESLGMNDCFTLTFDEERINGKAAPNRYFASYEQGENRILTVQAPASTLMASFVEPEKLKEREYLQFLEKVSRWDFNQDRLELYSRDPGGREAVLIYSAN